MGVHNFKDLLAHVGHEISVHTYEKDGYIFNVTCGCEDCQEVLLDFDNNEEDDNCNS